MSNARLLSGRSRVVGPGIKHPVPIALDPAAYEGSWVYGSDGEMHRSDGTEWKSVVQLAEDVAADVTRFIPEGTVVTVGAGGDFPTMRQAFQHLLGFVSKSTDGVLPAKIVIKAGHVVGDDQVLLTGTANLSWIVLESEDPIVDVDAALFTRRFPLPTSSVFPLFGIENTIGPIINARFRFISKAPLGGSFSAGNGTVGMDLRNASITSLEAASTPASRVGFEGADVGYRFGEGSSALLRRPLLVNCGWGVASLAGSSVYIIKPSLRSNVANCWGLFSNSNSIISVFGGNEVLDLRTTEGVNREWGDLVVTSQGRINIWGDQSANFLGGTNVRLNANDVFGEITAYQAAPTRSLGILGPDSYTVGTVPSATTYANSIIHVSNGNSGAPCLAVADGGVWKRIALGAAVAT